MCYFTIFMKLTSHEDFGSYPAFGQDGGGSIGVADPTHEMSFNDIAPPNQPMGAGHLAGRVLPWRTRL
jgi:hypothetical protein